MTINKSRNDYLKQGPVATYHIVDGFGVYVFDIIYDTEDYVVSAFYNSIKNRVERMTAAKVRYDSKNRAYFNKGKFKIYLDECMRTA